MSGLVAAKRDGCPVTKISKASLRDTARTMSQENVEIVRRSLDAFVREDWPAVLAALDPDVEVDDTDILDADQYEGHEAFFKWLEDWNESWESSRMEDIRVLDGGEGQIVALFRQVVRGKGSGIELDRADAMVFEIRNGMIVKLGYYNDQRQALEAAGLSE
jgi:ketosteroid isomerase-like protein